MAARETLVILRLPWGADRVETLPSKKAARARADELVSDYARLGLEAFEDCDGDFVVMEP